MKQWYKSKTLFINSIAAALVAFEAGTGLLQPLLPANLYVIVAVGLPVINAVLRAMTTKAITK